MDELDRARAELARLQSIEQSCRDQLVAALRAVDAQRMQLEELIKKQNLDPAIHRLPDELLVLIFCFAVVCLDYVGTAELALIGRWRRNLAGVSRRWRDVILDTPTLWQNIYLASQQDRRTLVSQLKRSKGVLLDITITGEADYSAIDELLHPLRPTTNRWRSLHIYDIRNHPNLCGTIRELSKLEFPSLVDIYVEMYPLDFQDLGLQNLLPRASALKHLVLQEVAPTDRFSIANPLKTLELTFALDDMPQWVLSRIPNISLVMLDLHGDAYNWVLEPNSIHFPLLEKLVLSIPDPDRFLEAITAPKLQYLEITADRCQWEAFGRSRSKFSSVYHLILELTITGESIPVDPHNGIALCQAFPNTRHAEFIHITDLIFFIMPISTPGNSTGSQTPADNWAGLETLSVFISAKDFQNHVEELNLLVQWLKIQQGFGVPKLHVNLKGVQDSPVDLVDLSILHSKLQDCCILEHCLPLSLGQLYATRGEQGEAVLSIW